MSTIDTEIDSTEQNSIVTSLIGQVTERLPGGSSPYQSNLDLDEAFMLLTNSRRRAIIQLLSDAGRGMPLSEISERIGAAEEGVDRDSLPSAARKRAYVTCYQCHLPKLEEHEVVVVEGDENIVIPAENYSTLLAVLRKTSTVVR